MRDKALCLSGYEQVPIEPVPEIAANKRLINLRK